MFVLGIDPGLSGGFCFIGSKGIISTLKTPTCSRPKRKGNYIDVQKVYDFINDYQYVEGEYLSGIYIERQFILRSQGMSSGSKTMYQSGILYGLCWPLCDNLQEINAKDWQKPIFKKVDESLIKSYNYNSDTKLYSIAYVEQTYGSKYLFYSSRQRKPSDGLADAICIGAYGLDQLTPKTTNK